MTKSFFHTDELSLGEKVFAINWGLVLLIVLVSGIGIALLYSAGGKQWQPWAGPQLIRGGMGIVIMLALALVDVRWWLRLAYPFYFVTLMLLVFVEISGHIGMGAQRWINLGFFVLQPSELMKISLILALARYFHALPIEDIGRIRALIPPAAMTLAPIALVLMQPNLGTAALLGLVATATFFVAGVKKWKFATVFVLVASSLPVLWHFMHDYQKRRVLTFMNPESDRLGAGYNIMQSKIALGAGGVFGKGFGNGTQSQLQFLPEKHTDFIFVVLAEEFGMMGALILLLLYALILAYGFLIATACQNQFARLAAFGLTVNFFLYLCVNIAMVTGMIPVVGIPLPLVSYGGTAILTLLIGFGILLSLSVHKEVRISRTGMTNV
ncbi:MAG: rod shape-determining protein RodA [Alphaproteobacteria bacterium]